MVDAQTLVCSVCGRSFAPRFSYQIYDLIHQIFIVSHELHDLSGFLSGHGLMTCFEKRFYQMKARRDIIVVCPE